MGTALVAVVGMMVFEEPMIAAKLTGSGLIVAGMVALNLIV